MIVLCATSVNLMSSQHQPVQMNHRYQSVNLNTKRREPACRFDDGREYPDSDVGQEMVPKKSKGTSSLTTENLQRLNLNNQRALDPTIPLDGQSWCSEHKPYVNDKPCVVPMDQNHGGPVDSAVEEPKGASVRQATPVNIEGDRKKNCFSKKYDLELENLRLERKVCIWQAGALGAVLAAFIFFGFYFHALFRDCPCPASCHYPSSPWDFDPNNPHIIHPKI